MIKRDKLGRFVSTKKATKKTQKKAVKTTKKAPAKKAPAKKSCGGCGCKKVKKA